MKIAIASEDGLTISQHFGRAPFYVIATIADGKDIIYETRPKMGHAQFQQQESAHVAEQKEDPRGHGYGSEAQNRHSRMADAIIDCDILLVRGMGRGLYESMEQAGIRPIVTDMRRIDEAVQAYLAGNLMDHTEHLH